MKALKKLAFLALALGIVSSSSLARADVIRLDYAEEQIDPALTFDEDCLGDEPAEDCDVRAAMIEGELVTLLSRLEGDDDPETLALFQASLELESPVVQAMAVQYLSRADQQPDDFFGKVKTFFFGPDAPLGVSSSAVLQTSADETDQRLAELFDEQRSASDYASQPPSEEPPLEGLLEATVKDARLNQMSSFSDTEQFQPAERLLMYDRFVRPIFDPTSDYPVTAFATDESLDDVSAFFSERFGKPVGPVAGVQQRVAELTQQLVALQSAAAGGDQDALKRIQAIAEELEQVQQVSNLDAFLQLSALHAENDLVWLDGEIDDVSLGAVRAITAGQDALLGKTVIRYLNAPTTGSSGGGAGTAGAGNGNGDGDGNSSAGVPSDPGSSPGSGGAAEPARDSSGADDGCGCAVPGGSRTGSGLVALSLLAWALRRSRRRA